MDGKGIDGFCLISAGFGKSQIYRLALLVAFGNS